MEAPIIRAVLDTSVLVPAGTRLELRNAGEIGLYEAYWSPWIIAELNRILTLQWLRRTNADLSSASLHRMSRSAKSMMTYLTQVLKVTNPQEPFPPAWPSLKDQDDLPVWAAAREVQAHYVVSENTHDYPPADGDGKHIWQGIEYISAAG